MKLIERIMSLFKTKAPIAYYTVDGNNLAPYPNMTDADLADFQLFEREMMGTTK